MGANMAEQILDALAAAGAERRSALDGELAKHLGFAKGQFEGRGRRILVAQRRPGRAEKFRTADLSSAAVSRKEGNGRGWGSLRAAKGSVKALLPRASSATSLLSAQKGHKRRSNDEVADLRRLSDSSDDSKKLRIDSAQDSADNVQLKAPENFVDECKAKTVKVLRAELKGLGVSLSGLKLKAEFVKALSETLAERANEEIRARLSANKRKSLSSSSRSGEVNDLEEEGGIAENEDSSLEHRHSEESKRRKLSDEKSERVSPCTPPSPSARSPLKSSSEKKSSLGKTPSPFGSVTPPNSSAHDSSTPHKEEEQRKSTSSGRSSSSSADSNVSQEKKLEILEEMEKRLDRMSQGASAPPSATKTQNDLVRQEAEAMREQARQRALEKLNSFKQQQEQVQLKVQKQQYEQQKEEVVKEQINMDDVVEMIPLDEKKLVISGKTLKTMDGEENGNEIAASGSEVDDKQLSPFKSVGNIIRAEPSAFVKEIAPEKPESKTQEPARAKGQIPALRKAAIEKEKQEQRERERQERLKQIQEKREEARQQQQQLWQQKVQQPPSASAAVASAVSKAPPSKLPAPSRSSMLPLSKQQPVISQTEQPPKPPPKKTMTLLDAVSTAKSQQSSLTTGSSSSSSTSSSKAVARSKPGSEEWKEENNYVLTDRSDSESTSGESDDANTNSTKKPVPEWAQRPNLNTALQNQYYGPNKPDPDSIFGKIPECDLEAIFKNNKRRYKVRNSSGIWHSDGLTVKEHKQYRKDLGFD